MHGQQDIKISFVYDSPAPHFEVFKLVQNVGTAMWLVWTYSCLLPQDKNHMRVLTDTVNSYISKVKCQ